jgi:hypothetical protein
MNEAIDIDEAMALDAEARQLREQLYGPISDEKWSGSIGRHWVDDVQWLRDRVELEMRKPNI